MIRITDECISCGACIDECPEEAIFEGGAEYELNGETKPALSDDYYFIVQEKCTQCKTCMEACPSEAIIEE